MNNFELMVKMMNTMTREDVYGTNDEVINTPVSNNNLAIDYYKTNVDKVDTVEAVKPIKYTERIESPFVIRMY